MKIQNIIRMQAMVIGIGVAMMLATAAHAQEIDNTVWNDGPNVAPFAQPAPAANNDLNLTAAVTPEANSAAVTTDANATNEAGVSQWSPVGGWLIGSLLVCIGLVQLREFAKANRSNGNIAQV